MYDSAMNVVDVAMGEHAHTIVQEDTMEGGLTPPATNSGSHNQLSALPSSSSTSSSSAKALLSKSQVDLISDYAVRVSCNLGERIFDSEDEEESQQVSSESCWGLHVADMLHILPHSPALPWTPVSSPSLEPLSWVRLI